MELLTTILMLLGLFATPDNLSDPDFQKINKTTIDHAQTIVNSNQYRYDETNNVIIIEDGVQD